MLKELDEFEHVVELVVFHAVLVRGRVSLVRVRQVVRFSRILLSNDLGFRSSDGKLWFIFRDKRLHLLGGPEDCLLLYVIFRFGPRLGCVLFFSDSAFGLVEQVLDHGFFVIPSPDFEPMFNFGCFDLLTVQHAKLLLFELIQPRYVRVVYHLALEIVVFIQFLELRPDVVSEVCGVWLGSRLWKVDENTFFRALQIGFMKSAYASDT